MRRKLLLLFLVVSMGFLLLAAQAPRPAKPANGAEARSTFAADLEPIRSVFDPYPTFNGIAVDPQNNIAVITDENRHSVITYDRRSGGHSRAVTTPKRIIMGRETRMRFVAGVALDPERREMYVADNDGELLHVFSYDDEGDATAVRSLLVPHQTWGVSLSLARNEFAVSVEQLGGIVTYRRGAKGLEKPLRAIVGPDTGLEDPHGVFLDAANNEIVVTNHGNWTELRTYSRYDPLHLDQRYVAGRSDPPSITVYPADADGNARPKRVIQGPQTRLNWPMALDVDTAHSEIAVANYGLNSILIFGRTQKGDVEPLRQIHGPRTRIVGPVGVAVDAKNGEIWVANYGEHTAVVFPRTASGDAAPLRVIRNAPAGSPTCGFTNASAVAYDSKRGEILVPN